MYAQAEVQSETAYDALQDGREVMLRVLVEPRTVDSLAAEGVGDPATLAAILARLERAGLVRRVENRFEAVAMTIHQTRMEGMVSSLTRYVLPLSTQLTLAPGEGFVAQLELELSREEQRELRAGFIQPLLEKLEAISILPGGRKRAGTAIFAGTSDVPAASVEADRMLETIRRCARQRTSAEADRAVLTQLDALFSPEHAAAAEDVLRGAARAWSSRVPSSGAPSRYTLLMAFHFSKELRS